MNGTQRSRQAGPRAAKVKGLVLGLFVLAGLPHIAQAVVSIDEPVRHRLEPSAFGGAFNGIARLDIPVDDDIFRCTASLLEGGSFMLTAAHCLDQGTDMTARFTALGIERSVTGSWIREGYVAGRDASNYGGFDLALVRLDRPVTETAGFRLSPQDDFGKQILIAGHGMTGTGASGETDLLAGHDTVHYGYNQFDARGIDFWDALYAVSLTPIGDVYLMDFDDGSAQYNTLERLRRADSLIPWGPSSAGVRGGDSLIGHGDSGSGAYTFRNGAWWLSAVASFLDSPCPDYDLDCDAVPGLNASFGDLAGFTAVHSHIDWIHTITSAVPEVMPTWAWALGLAWLAQATRRQVNTATLNS